MFREQTFHAEAQSQYCALVRLGCSRRRAARLLGFPESTIRNLMARDRDFHDQVYRAECGREVVALQNIRAAAEKSWRAQAWLLERLNPDDFNTRPTRQAEKRERREAMQAMINSIFSAIKSPDDRRAAVDRMRGLKIGWLTREAWNDGNVPNDRRIPNEYDDFLDSLLDKEPPQPPPNDPWDGPNI